MKAWEVVAITRDGEHICEDCLKDPIEETVWADSDNAHELMEEYGIGVVFASDDTADEAVCGRCGGKIL